MCNCDQSFHQNPAGIANDEVVVSSAAAGNSDRRGAGCATTFSLARELSVIDQT
jgi:hypothetical protein